MITYQKSELIFDGTYYFAHKYLNRFDRTIDQMVQSARSCKQNIVEASMASGTSKVTELTLTNIARASLEELKKDFGDYIRTRHLKLWDKNHPYYAELTKKWPLAPKGELNYYHLFCFLSIGTTNEASITSKRFCTHKGMIIEADISQFPL